MTFANPSNSSGTPAGFRTLETARGAFILPWRPDAVKYLLCSEALGPAELAVGGRDAARALARDLFLLGLQDEMDAGGAPRTSRSPISRVARGLMRLLGDRRG